MAAADKPSAIISTRRAASAPPSAYLEISPLPLALWDASRRSCKFNTAALSLLRFSQEEFQTQPDLWLQRVYENDLLAWHTLVRRFSNGNKLFTCDYRFFPKNASVPIWIREIMMPLGTLQSPWFSMSAYIDISDLKKVADRQPPDRLIPAQNHDETLRGLFHEMNNRLQRLSMTIELAGLESQIPANVTKELTDSLLNVTQALALIHERVLGTKSHD